MVDPYELVPEPRKPRLPGTVVVRADEDEVIDAAAADLLVQATMCVRHFGDFHLAVSASPLLERLYMRLMYDPNYRSLPWKRTHLWFVHEAGAGAESGGTYGMVREVLVEHADIPRSQVHPMIPGHRTGREDYERELREALAWREKGHDRLDFVLLHADGGGGVSGIRVGEREAVEPGVLVREGPAGLRLTRGMINASRLIGVVASGLDARPMVERFETGQMGDEAPVAWLSPMAGVMRWYLDHDACPQGGRGENGA